MDEKRRYMRFNLSLKGRLQVESGIQLSPHIQIVDFSREGLKIAFPKNTFLKANIVKLEFYLPTRTLPISIHGKTQWLRPKGPNWEMGIKIEKIDNTEKDEILDYAYKVWRYKEKRKESEQI